MNIISLIIQFFRKLWHYIQTGECDEKLLNSNEHNNNNNNDNDNDNETVQIHFYQIYGDRV
jgi:hypothetical protein